MSDIEIEIDGQVCKAKADQMVIQVADDAGIYIPRFCYHKHLSIAANCRMCLVDVEKSPKPLPACATPVMPGMKVFTKTAKALAAQRAVMEFLLINHPLDCPICDQGGECELQDISMGYGAADSHFCEGKRAVKDQDIGPLIETEMTRCIQCTRCVRFGDEIAGLRELGALNRGENMEISTYVQHVIHSEVSGNIIDLCPVGALTSKPYRFTARAWELQQTPTIAAHDCIGSNLYAHTRGGQVMRMVPHENAALNQTWISDRDRFSYEGLQHADRLTKPMIRVHGKLQETDWLTAIEFAAQGLQRVLNNAGANQVAALASPNSTTEEFYLLQKLLRGVGSPHVDHRLRQIDFAEQDHLPEIPFSLNAIDEADVILLIGSHIHKEQPSAGLRVRKAFKRGAKIIAVNMVDYRFHFDLSAKKIIAPQLFVHALASIAEGKDELASIIASGKKVCVLLGALAIHHPQGSLIRDLTQKIVQQANASLGVLTPGANAAGAILAGAVPEYKVGLDVQAMLRDARKAYVLLNVEPDVDCANPGLAMAALRAAEFVVSLSVFKNQILDECAHVILPVVPFTETSGTFVNVAGDWQTFKGVAKTVGEARPAWKVLRVLGNQLQVAGFDYESTDQIRAELQNTIAAAGIKTKSLGDISLPILSAETTKIYRIGEIPLYAIDNVVRRAPALQAIQPVMEGQLDAVRMNAAMAQQLGLSAGLEAIIKQEKESVRLSVVLDERVPMGAVMIAGGIDATKGLGELFGEVEIG